MTNIKERVLQLLVIDDDEFDREIVQRTLSRSTLTYELSAVDSAAAALQLIESNHYDCLLLDYLIPPTNGLDLLKKLAERGPMPAVVMLTGMGDEDVAVKAMKLGVHDYISKDKVSTRGLNQAILKAIEEKEHYRNQNQRREELERLSFYDSLTGLANRNLLIDRLTETIKSARRQKTRFAVLLMDLDGFKQVNDTLGHHAGDELLTEIGSRLTLASRDSDTVARLGGDEFTLLLPNINDFMGATTVAQKLVDAIAKPFRVDGNDIQVGVSVGIALYPEHGTEHHSLLKNADAAMYKAKQTGNGYSIYAQAGSDNHDNNIAADLPNLASTDDLILYYQPKVNLDTSECVGAEVLIRWNHPVLGLLPPQEFVPAAEKSTIIRELSYKIIDLAMAQVKNWQKNNLNIPLAINLSSRMLEDHDISARLDEIRRRHGTRTDQFTFEVTESALIVDPRRARKILEIMASDGYKISVDDFGTGYSSLSYLRDFPIHEIKIDKTFVQPARDDARNGYIVEAVLRLARAFNATAVAEGIEDRATWQCLADLGCDDGQGYFISHPVGADDLELWLQQWRMNLLSDRLQARQS